LHLPISVYSLTTKRVIVKAASSLLPSRRINLSPQENKLLINNNKERLGKEETENLKFLIRSGQDPLGDAYCALRSQDERRKAGAIYTPYTIIAPMVNWPHFENLSPARIVDAGAGSGRFILRAGAVYNSALLIGIERDPIAALILRANASVLNMLPRLQVIVGDYRSVNLNRINGATLFIGNPPYTRHHNISKTWKDWFSNLLSGHNIPSSKLAGLHVHFFAKTLQLSKEGDYGVFITSSEWLDVNYGKVLRHMLTNGLGGLSIHVLSPESLPFNDAHTTGAITCFKVGSTQTSIKFRSVDSPSDLKNLSEGGHKVSKSLLNASSRWSIYVKRTRSSTAGSVKIGDIFRVHRGQVTGCNRVFIEGGYDGELPGTILYPTVTRAQELFDSAIMLTSSEGFKNVIDIPEDLSQFGRAERKKINRFLTWAIQQKANESYIAKHRKPWWSVRLYQPAPIICTYMARRSPRFIRNLCDMRHINIAHGLYPVTHLSNEDLDLVVNWLNHNVSKKSGRTYAGGLTKFEPGEVANIIIPSIDQLRDGGGL